MFTRIHCTLQLRGKRVLHIIVQELLKEIDPEGSDLKKAHCLKKRKYHNPGPNYAWHCDSYDKLKVTSNLRGCPLEKKFVCTLFSRKPPQTIYQQKGYKM